MDAVAPGVLLISVGFASVWYAAGNDASALAAVVHVADCIVHALDLAGDEQDVVPAVSAPAWKNLSLGQEVLAQVYRETEMQFEEACQILVSAPSKQ